MIRISLQTLLLAATLPFSSWAAGENQQQDSRLLIERIFRQYLQAFSDGDLDGIEKFYTYPAVFNGDRAKVIINAEKLFSTYTTNLSLLPDNYAYSKADNILIVAIGNERYKAVVKVSHWTQNDEWLGSKESIYYYKNVKPNAEPDYRIHHYTPR